YSQSSAYQGDFAGRAKGIGCPKMALGRDQAETPVTKKRVGSAKSVTVSGNSTNSVSALNCPHSRPFRCASLSWPQPRPVLKGPSSAAAARSKIMPRSNQSGGSWGSGPRGTRDIEEFLRQGGCAACCPAISAAWALP